MAFLAGQTWYVGSTKYTTVAQWAATTTYVAGNVVRQLAAPSVGNERCFVCTIAGTSGGSEPAWTITQGAKNAADGTVTWIEVTGKAGVNGDLTNTNNWTSVKNTAISVGVIIQRNSGGSLQICTTAGTAGNGSEPSFSDTAGTTTSDNTVTWTSLGAPGSFGAWAAPAARMLYFLSGVSGATADFVNVSSNHAAINNAASATSAAVRMVFRSVNDTVVPPTSLLAGASEQWNSASTFQAWNVGNVTVYFNGITFAGGSSGSSNGVNHLGTWYDGCTFSGGSTTSMTGWGTTNPNQACGANIRNCTFVFGATSQSAAFTNGLYRIKNCTFAATGSIPTTLFGGFICTSYIEDSDLSNVTGNLVSNTGGGNFYLDNNKTANGVTVNTGTFSGQPPATRLHNSDSAATNYRYYYQGYAGTIQQETTVVRTGGATNGTTPISWNITTNANTAFAQPLISEEISNWNSATGSPLTATLYVTSNTALDNSQLWVEVEYPGSSATPLGSLVNTRMAWFGTPVALTSDGSTWGGAISNKYKITITFTPQMAGPIKFRIYAAVASATIYVDPQIIIGTLTPSRDFLIPGWGYINSVLSSLGFASGG